MFVKRGGGLAICRWRRRRGDKPQPGLVWRGCMEESVIKIERRDENSSGSLYGNVSVEFSSVQPTQRAPLRNTFDDCTLIFFFARHVTNIRKNIPHLSLSYPKNRRQLSPLRPMGTTCCRFIMLQATVLPRASNAKYKQYKRCFLCIYLAPFMSDTFLHMWEKVTVLQVISRS